MKTLATICIIATLSFGSNCIYYSEKARKHITLMELSNNIESMQKHYIGFEYYVDLAIVECNGQLSDALIEMKTNVSKIMSEIKQ